MVRYGAVHDMLRWRRQRRQESGDGATGVGWADALVGCRPVLRLWSRLQATAAARARTRPSSLGCGRCFALLVAVTGVAAGQGQRRRLRPTAWDRQRAHQSRPGPRRRQKAYRGLLHCSSGRRRCLFQCPFRCFRSLGAPGQPNSPPASQQGELKPQPCRLCRGRHRFVCGLENPSLQCLPLFC